MNIIHNISRTQPTAMRLMKKLAIPAMALMLPLTLASKTTEKCDSFSKSDKQEIIQKAGAGEGTADFLTFITLAFFGSMFGGMYYKKRHQ